MSSFEPDSRNNAQTDVFEDVERAIASLESHADPAVRDAARTLLEGTDAVHRAGLTHLVRAIHATGGEAFLNRLTGDPAIRLLLMSYNLIAVDRRLQAEEALDGARGHLHDHGVDVELLEVVGGVVYVRIHTRPGLQPSEALAMDAVRRDLEATLLARFIGFQELVFRERDQVEAVSQIVPLAAIRRANRPVYENALMVDELPAGGTRAVHVKGVPVLLAAVDGEVYAIRNQCGDSPLPLDLGTLAGSEVTCPWHGCRYDVRSGRRVDAQPGQVQVFPVSVDEGHIRIALDVAPGGSS